jgi:hypothetical protein
VQSKSIRSVPFDAMGSINSHSGTTSLIFVRCVRRAPGPRVMVSLNTINPAERAVKSFEFEALLNKVFPTDSATTMEPGERTHIPRHAVPSSVGDSQADHILLPAPAPLPLYNDKRGALDPPIPSELVQFPYKMPREEVVPVFGGGGEGVFREREGEKEEQGQREEVGEHRTVVVSMIDCE